GRRAGRSETSRAAKRRGRGGAPRSFASILPGLPRRPRLIGQRDSISTQTARVPEGTISREGMSNARSETSMPTYENRCAKCGEHLEVFQSFSEAPLTKHAQCGGKLAKVLSPAGIVLKGSGFYKTDNRGSKSGSRSKESSSSESKSAEAKS